LFVCFCLCLRMRMWICMYVDMYVCMYVCMHICLYVYRSMSSSLHITASLQQGVHSTRPIAFSANLCKIAARGEVIDFPPGNTTSQDPGKIRKLCPTHFIHVQIVRPCCVKAPWSSLWYVSGARLDEPLSGPRELELHFITGCAHKLHRLLLCKYRSTGSTDSTGYPSLCWIALRWKNRQKEIKSIKCAQVGALRIGSIYVKLMCYASAAAIVKVLDCEESS
jgi:hypothetical protein